MPFKQRGNKMKHKTFILVMIVFVVATLGCKVQKKDEIVVVNNKPKTQPARVKQPSTRELQLDDIFIETRGQLQPNLYDLVFSWPETKDRVRVTYNNQVLFLVATSEGDHFAVRNLQGGKTYSLLIEILDQQNHIITSSTQDVVIPADYVFPKNFKLNGNMTITNERVFMSNSIITTGNFNLEIKTKNLIVLEQSYIQGFEPMAKAKYGVDGRSGGTIAIQAESAEGSLDITMNSEAGGDGLKGFESPSCQAGNFCYGRIHCRWGTKGKSAGRNGDLIIKINNVRNFKLYHQEILASGGMGGPTQDDVTSSDYPVVKENRDCKLPPHKEPNPHGVAAQPGKICLMLSDLMPATGCE